MKVDQLYFANITMVHPLQYINVSEINAFVTHREPTVSVQGALLKTERHYNLLFTKE